LKPLFHPDDDNRRSARLPPSFPEAGKSFPMSVVQLPNSIGHVPFPVPLPDKYTAINLPYFRRNARTAKGSSARHSTA